MHDIGDLGKGLFYITEEEKREYEEEKRRRAYRDYESESYCREGLRTALKSVIIDLAINPDKMIEEEEFHELATLLQNVETALYAHTHFAWRDETEPF